MAILPKVNVKIRLDSEITDMDPAFRNAIIAQNDLEPDVIINENLLKNYTIFTLKSQDFGGETLNSLKYLELFGSRVIRLIIESEDWTASNYDNLLNTMDWVTFKSLSKKINIQINNISPDYNQGKLLEITNPDFKSVDSLTYDNDSYITINELNQTISNLKPISLFLNSMEKVYNSISDILGNYLPRYVYFHKINENFRISNFTIPNAPTYKINKYVTSANPLNLATSFPNGFQGLTYCYNLSIEKFLISANDVLEITDYINTMDSVDTISLEQLQFGTYETFLALADSSNENAINMEFTRCIINGNPMSQEDLEALQALKPNWNISF